MTDLLNWWREMPALDIYALNEKDTKILARFEEIIKDGKKGLHPIEQLSSMNAVLRDWWKKCPIFDPSLGSNQKSTCLPLNGGEIVHKADRRFIEDTKMETQHMIQTSETKEMEPANSDKTEGDNESKTGKVKKERPRTRWITIA
ncbi:Hypothetical protein CINCED_3A013234 [Cinara cedri]|nr:Hypothetical protein CINCED_3A013234 [Cinara cedri]